MKFIDTAKDTLRGVQAASAEVQETTQWATTALVSVCVVSVAALLLATIALMGRPTS